MITKYILMAGTNIRKNKSASITLIIMFIISALLLNAGLLVALNYGRFFQDLKEELNPADAYYFFPDAIYTDEVNDYMDTREHVISAQRHEALYLNAQIDSKSAEKSYQVMFSRMREAREISKWKYVGEYLPPDDMSVYVPDIFKSVNGFKLNDLLTLEYEDKHTGEKRALVFTVKGYIEDIFFSTSDTGFLNFYVTDNVYESVGEILQNANYKGHVVFTDLDELKSVSIIESDLRELLKLKTSSLTAGDPSQMLVTVDIELVELARCMMASIVSVMMVVFALIIVAVCILVVRFRISNSIEDDMMKLGSLKSVGYTSGQLIRSIILQYGIIAAIGSIIGIAASYPVLPAVSLVFEQQSGLKWEQGFDGLISFGALAVMLAAVILVSVIAARKVTALSPINALRGETASKRSKKNRVRLENAKGSASFVLAIKHAAQNMKQSATIAVIVAAVTFTGTFGVIMLYNTSVDTEAFQKVPGYEICNAIAVLNPAVDTSGAVTEIRNMADVKKAQFFDEVKVGIEGLEVTTFVMEDYSEKETIHTYDGRYPEAAFEIALAGVLAERIGKKVGDAVTVSVGSVNNTFKVVGLSNGSSMGGQSMSMRTDDYLSLNPAFKPQSLFVYLDDGADTAGFIERLKETFSKDVLMGVSNFDELMAEGMASYQNIVSILGVVMFIITLIVVALVLYFVIGASVIRRKREFGIEKALGYTTPQLMNQLAVCFTIPIILGAAAGALACALYINPIMSIPMKFMGIMKAGFVVNSVWVIVFGAATIVFAYVISLLAAYRIRKISAYALVTE